MHQEEQIKLTIDGLGRPVIEAVGFTGTGCTDATSGIEKALSNVPVNRDLKAEYHQTGSAEAEVYATHGGN